MLQLRVKAIGSAIPVLKQCLDVFRQNLNQKDKDGKWKFPMFELSEKVEELKTADGQKEMYI